MEIEVLSYGRMEKASSELMAQAESYRLIAGNMTDSARSLEAFWKGSDQEAYILEIEKMNAELKRLADRLENEAQILKKEKNNYLVRQENNITAIKRFGA